jgi:hypothetical protein
MTNQLASMAIDLANNATIRGSDAEKTAAVKRWLSDIATGKLIVSKAPEAGPVVSPVGQGEGLNE